MSRLSTLRHVRRSVIAALLAFAGVIAALSHPSDASAFCGGTGGGGTDTHYAGGAIARAQEKPVSGTCNGNNTYQGYIRDAHADGVCALVEFNDNQSGWGSVAATCGSSWERYPIYGGYHDIGGNMRLVARLCAWGGCTEFTNSGY